MVQPARILSIAGSDSSGGAGIQADIKTITMLGGYAMTAITAVTAQNTLGVTAVEVLSPELVLAQIDACVTDIGVDAIKIGMLGSAAIALAVAERMERIAAPIVFDPVMVATSGAVLADGGTIAAFRSLAGRATLVTPNLPELEVLGGIEAVLAIASAVLVKGGHGEGNMLFDRLVTRSGETVKWGGARIDTTSTHGTGCTLASAIATGLGKGQGLAEAISHARNFVRAALAAAPGFGKGHGPLGHQAVRKE
jgi:hydroxymethylpyrimidine/phosphomethylpyrimidine kinase